MGTTKNAEPHMQKGESRMKKAGRTIPPIWFSRSGMAVPMIIIFIIFLGIFIGTMTFNRMTVKRQTKTTFEYLSAHYMAQSALQHMSLKLRLLPNEAYDSSAISLGICPFNTDGSAPAAPDENKFSGPLDVFRGDISTVTDPDGTGPVVQGYPLATGVSDGSLDSFDGTASDITDGWGYQITMANALTAYTSGTTRILVIEVQAEGRARSFSNNQESQRIETIKKTMEIKRTPDSD